MKLRTELKNKVAGGVVAMGVDGSDVSHDLLAAHALLQAMREAGDGSADVAFYSDEDYQNWVYDRADELMREWTGEVAK